MSHPTQTAYLQNHHRSQSNHNRMWSFRRQYPPDTSETLIDLFKTKREAALDWGMYYNGYSIIRGREMGSSIYEVTENGQMVGYSYSPAVLSKEHRTSYSLPPQGEKTVATIHSHGNYTGHIKGLNGKKRKVYDNKFSSTDKSLNKESNLTGFLATPNGSLLEHNPETGQISVLSTDLPSDPADPTRLNNIKPTLEPYEQPLITQLIDWIKELFNNK